MDMYSKMDGSAPVSPVLGGLWEVQKKGRTDDQKNENRKKGREKKEEGTDFEDGRVPGEQEMTTDGETQVKEDNTETDSKNDNPSKTRKIDIII
jgi:hypothetical protein